MATKSARSVTITTTVLQRSLFLVKSQPTQAIFLLDEGGHLIELSPSSFTSMQLFFAARGLHLVGKGQAIMTLTSSVGSDDTDEAVEAFLPNLWLLD